MGDRESLIRKLKKLRAKAESAEKIGSEAEAQSFAEAVQRMLSDYKVEEAEIAADDDRGSAIVSISPDTAKHGIGYRQREVPWMQDLAGIVAWGHYCRMTFVPKCSVVFFVGRESDAQVAADVWCKLVVVAESLADKEYVNYFYECKRAGNVRGARGFRQSFLIGFVGRLRTRYWEHMESIRAYYAHNQLALSTLKDARSRVNEYVEKNSKKGERKKTTRIENREGWLRGQDKAQELSLSGHREVA